MRPVALLGALTLAALVAGVARGSGQDTRAHDQFVLAEAASSPPAELAAALGRIEAPALAAHVAFLASPALEGRGLGGRGLEAAAEYAATALALAGVEPLQGRGGNDEAPRASYFQPVPVRALSGLAAELTIETAGPGASRRQTFSSPLECRLAPWPPGGLAGPVVFAGHGIREPKLGHDDYAGLDVRGALVLVRRGVPGVEAFRDAALAARYDGREADERWERKLETAEALGAAAVLAVEREEITEPRPEAPAGESFLPLGRGAEPPPLVRVSPAVARALLGDAAKDPARPAGPLPGVTAALRASGRERVVWSRNVIGVLAGRDPRLRDEAVVLGAHLDHLGLAGGVLHPGADDNASGVAALVEIARAFARLKVQPKRTLVFAFWTGEEEGKFGSGHYVRQPLWPLARTVAYVNLDMIAHAWRPEEIRKLVVDSGVQDAESLLARITPATFAEPGLPPDAPELDAALRWAGPVAGMTLRLDRTDGTHGGSDYRDFARARVPFVRFFGNFFPDYHQPGDTPETLDAGQLARMARLVFATAYRLAEP